LENGEFVLLLNDIPKNIKSTEIYRKALEKKGQCNKCNNNLELLDYINSNIRNHSLSGLNFKERVMSLLKLWNSEEVELYCCDCFFIKELEQMKF
jgi:transcriptional regulator